MTDWISDPNLSAEEKLARFEALGPRLTRGPRKKRTRPAARTVTAMPMARLMSAGRSAPILAVTSAHRYVPPTIPHVPPTALTSEVGTAALR